MHQEDTPAVNVWWIQHSLFYIYPLMLVELQVWQFLDNCIGLAWPMYLCAIPVGSMWSLVLCQATAPLHCEQFHLEQAFLTKKCSLIGQGENCDITALTLNLDQSENVVIEKMRSVPWMAPVPSKQTVFFTMQQGSQSPWDWEATGDHCSSGSNFHRDSTDAAHTYVHCSKLKKKIGLPKLQI